MIIIIGVSLLNSTFRLNSLSVSFRYSQCCPNFLHSFTVFLFPLLSSLLLTSLRLCLGFLLFFFFIFWMFPFFSVHLRLFIWISYSFIFIWYYWILYWYYWNIWFCHVLCLGLCRISTGHFVALPTTFYFWWSPNQWSVWSVCAMAFCLVVLLLLIKLLKYTVLLTFLLGL